MGKVIRFLWALPNTVLGALLLPAALRGGTITLVNGVIEAQGPLLSIVLRRCVPIDGGAAAITLGHIVLGRDVAALEITRAHERAHVRQCERWGPLFIPAYLAASVWAGLMGGGAYEDNYFERQACGADD